MYLGYNVNWWPCYSFQVKRFQISDIMNFCQFLYSKSQKNVNHTPKSSVYVCVSVCIFSEKESLGHKDLFKRDIRVSK